MDPQNGARINQCFKKDECKIGNKGIGDWKTSAYIIVAFTLTKDSKQIT